jgi:beta-glucanase (GH16 family)
MLPFPASCLLVAAAALCLMIAPLESAQPWRLVWSDEFNGPANSGVNTAEWIYDIGTQYPGGPPQWGTGEVEIMTSSTANVYQDGAGRLVVKPLHTGTVPALGWTSGRIETVRFFDAPSGGAFAIEASIQQPNITGVGAAGYWAAFWILGSAFRGNYWNWPEVGEIDIMEGVNGRTSTFATLHCGTAPGGPCHEFTGLTSGERPCVGCQTGLHVYRMELDRASSPQEIRWYLDGVNFFTLDSTVIDAATWSQATEHPFFIILNVAIGGAFPAAFGGGPTSATVSGVPMVVDYVRVYKRSAEFTDDDLKPGTTIRAVHVAQLRTRVNAVRRQFGISEVKWMEELAAGATAVRADHFIELRAALLSAYKVAGHPAPDFDSSLAVGNPVKAVHVTELRSAVAALE